jgi:diadenosine tetraphosphate (Ap4A) HIT family hydrolase
MQCPFCVITSERKTILETRLSYCLLDKYPVSPGHILIIPKRHSQNYFENTAEEKKDLWLLVDQAVEFIKNKYNPDGFNIGINVNEAAGQTVFHTHIHVIPRYFGDVDEPRGGVRRIINSNY